MWQGLVFFIIHDVAGFSVGDTPCMRMLLFLSR